MTNQEKDIRIVLFKEKNNYYFITRSLNDFPKAVVNGNLIYEDNIPIGRIATEEDLKREEKDNKLEWGEL